MGFYILITHTDATALCFLKIKVSFQTEVYQKLIQIYVFPEMKLGDRVLSCYIHVCVSNLYIPRIGLPTWLQQNKQPNPGNM